MSSASAEILFFEGNRQLAAGDFPGAEECFRQALSLNPDFGEALANLGWLRERVGAVDEAEACYRRAAVLDPGMIQNSLNLGVLLTNGKRFDEAESVYLQVLKQVPDSPAAWSNLGVLLACLKREVDAEACYRTALALDDSYAKARFNLAYILLRQGRFEEGWHCLEARDWYAMLDRHFTCPRWRGESLAGKSVVIGLEAGHGDMIQFCRYVPLLKSMGADRVSIVCHPGLNVLFASLSGIDEVLSLDDEVPSSGWNFWTPPLSLPYYCQTRLDTVPAPIPYLAAEPGRVERWRLAMPAHGLRVGLVWKGNPRFENDADRSLPSLDVLVPLGSVAGVQFVSLQKGAGEDEARCPPPGLSVLAFGHTLEDFADTAALVSCLDLVICVDTAVAHLAGALGKPCWVLLPDYRTDWRWLSGRADSPWYPQQMRLFRQPPGGGWTAVVDAVVEALKIRARGEA